MSLKKLGHFQIVDTKRLLAKDQFLFTKAEEWKEGSDSESLRTVGTKITGVIAIDGADYGDDSLRELNRGESLTIKVQQPLSAFNDWKPFGSIFKITEVTKAVIYGQFRNQLSITVPSLEKIK